jgi:large subunit ribosomal protein L13
MASGTGAASAADNKRDWFVVDASGLVLGRLATRIARVLSGKHRPSYIPYLDTGDFVVVTNADKIKMTGNKLGEKMYHRHTGYPGGLKSVAAKDLQAKYPERLIEAAVRGMLPKSKLGRKQLKKLKVYRGPKHPHEAQQPRALKISAASGGKTSAVAGEKK